MPIEHFILGRMGSADLYCTIENSLAFVRRQGMSTLADGLIATDLHMWESTTTGARMNCYQPVRRFHYHLTHRRPADSIVECMGLYE